MERHSTRRSKHQSLIYPVVANSFEVYAQDSEIRQTVRPQNLVSDIHRGSVKKKVLYGVDFK